MVSTVKANDQFKNHTLAKLIGILKSHENEVTKEGKVLSGMRSLSLIAKGQELAEDGSCDIPKITARKDRFVYAL